MIHEMEPCERESLEWWGVVRGMLFKMWAPREGTSKLRSETWDRASCCGICKLFSSPNIHCLCFDLNKGWQRNQSPFWSEKISSSFKWEPGRIQWGEWQIKMFSTVLDNQLALSKQSLLPSDSRPWHLLDQNWPAAWTCKGLYILNTLLYALKWALTFNIVKWGLEVCVLTQNKLFGPADESLGKKMS